MNLWRNNVDVTINLLSGRHKYKTKKNKDILDLIKKTTYVSLRNSTMNNRHVKWKSFKNVTKIE